MTDYDTDLAAWAIEQAAMLRQRSVNSLDWENLAEEIEAVGISQKREVYARLRRICQHLLKWQFQPEQQCRSWRATIRTQRRDLERVLRDSPSFRPYAATELADAFDRGREDAEEETGLLHLPAACPWTIEQVLDLEFLP
jgi:hypothetical protein